jgi:hypothetical protein
MLPKKPRCVCKRVSQAADLPRRWNRSRHRDAETAPLSGLSQHGEVAVRDVLLAFAGRLARTISPNAQHLGPSARLKRFFL